MAQTLTGSLQNESLPEAEITCQHRNKNELPNIPPPLSFIFNLKNQTQIFKTQLLVVTVLVCANLARLQFGLFVKHKKLLFG